MRREGQIRVVIVDDSPTVRSLVRRLLQRDPACQVVGEAGDGARGVELVTTLHPDVVVMDLDMPVLDGHAAIQQIAQRHPTPVLVLTAHPPADQAASAFEATRCGAVEVLAKPSEPEGWRQLEHTLASMIRALAEARRVPPAKAAAGRAAKKPVVPPLSRQVRFIAVAASTGGPEATLQLLQPLPKPLPAALLLVQHIAAGFEESLASWLAGKLGTDVAVARDGEPAAPGRIRLAPPGAHLLLTADETMHLDRDTPPRAGHRPSADELFLSCARTFPTVTAGVVLTGMGSDGALGLAELRRCGGLTMAQDQESSVVFGMPRAALESGAVELSLPPAELGELLARYLERSTS
jgi:two-component system chemotaxis response regulator CheB